MAATVAAAAAAGAGAPHVKWSPSEYAFNPYELTAHKLPPAEDEEKLTGKAAGAGGVPIKRRPGRQKRTSVLCQVRASEREGKGGGAATLCSVVGHSASRPGSAGAAAAAPASAARPRCSGGSPDPTRPHVGGWPYAEPLWFCCVSAPPLQVPGCGEELVSAKNYYRRYRICQSHCNM